MPVLNAVQSLMNPITLDGNWQTVNTTDGRHSGYFIAMHRTSASGNENLQKGKVKKIYLEFGIDTGISGSVMSTTKVVLDFDSQTSEDEALNKRTAYTIFDNFSPKFYYRIWAIETADQLYNIGDKISAANPVTDILLNLLPLSFR